MLNKRYKLSDGYDFRARGPRDLYTSYMDDGVAFLLYFVLICHRNVHSAYILNALV